MDQDIVEKLEKVIGTDLAKGWTQMGLDTGQLNIMRYIAVPNISVLHAFLFGLQKYKDPKIVKYFNQVYEKLLENAIKYKYHLNDKIKQTINGHNIIQITNRHALHVGSFNDFNYDVNIDLKRGQKIEVVEDYIKYSSSFVNKDEKDRVDLLESILRNSPIFMFPDKNETSLINELEYWMRGMPSGSFSGVLYIYMLFNCYISIVGASKLDLSIWGESNTNTKIVTGGKEKVLENIAKVFVNDQKEKENQNLQGKPLVENKSGDKNMSAIADLVLKMKSNKQFTNTLKNKLDERFENIKDMDAFMKDLATLSRKQVAQDFADVKAEIHFLKTEMYKTFIDSLNKFQPIKKTLTIDNQQKINKDKANIDDQLGKLDSSKLPDDKDLNKVRQYISRLESDKNTLKQDMENIINKINDGLKEYNKKRLQSSIRDIKQQIDRYNNFIDGKLREIDGMLRDQGEEPFQKVDITPLTNFKDRIDKIRTTKITEYQSWINADQFKTIKQIKEFLNKLTQDQTLISEEFNKLKQDFKIEYDKAKQAFEREKDITDNIKPALNQGLQEVRDTLNYIPGHPDINKQKGIMETHVQDMATKINNLINIADYGDEARTYYDEIGELIVSAKGLLADYNNKVKKRELDAEELKKIQKEYKRSIYINIAIIQYVLNEIYKKGKDIKQLNPVFYNKVKNSEIYSLYNEKTEPSKLLTMISSWTNDEHIYNTTKDVKNDYELLRGPVRIYLILKPFGSSEDPKKPIFKKKGYTVDVQSACFDLFDFEKQLERYNEPTLRGMIYISPQNKKKDYYKNKYEKTLTKTYIDDSVPSFSRVYTPESESDSQRDPVFETDSAEDIFNNNVKETIDNNIGVSDTIFMAYGPSGSGKTFNLIGDDDELKHDKVINPNDTSSFGNLGILFHTLNYLIKSVGKFNIEKIEVSSKQYYSLCSDISEVREFDSLSYLRKIGEGDSFDQEYIYGKGNITQFIDQYNVNNKNPYIYRYSHVKESLKVLDLDKLWVAYTNGGNISDPEKQGLFREKLHKDTYPVNDGIKAFVNVDVDSLNNTHYFQLHPINFLSLFINTDLFKARWMYIEDDAELVSWGAPFHTSDRSREIQVKLLTELQVGSMEDLYKAYNYIKTNKKDIENSISTPMTRIATIQKEQKNVENAYYYGLIKKLVNYGQLYTSDFSNITQDTSSDENIITLYDKKQKYDSFNVLKKYYLAIKRARPTRGTPLNPESSRSHLIISIKVSTKEKVTNLSFVDLAGNEKADENLFTMRQEGNGITASLIAIKSLLEAKQRLTVDEFENLKAKEQRVKYSKREYYSLVGKGNKCEKETFNRLWLKFFNFFKKGKDSTISMYLNLPTYMFGKNKSDSNKNRCLAIGDSLAFVDGLMKNTQISRYFPKPNEIKLIEDGAARAYAFGRRRGRRSRRSRHRRTP